MSDDSLAALYSLLAAFFWAVGLVLFRQSGEQVPPLALNLFKNTVGLLLIAATLLLTGQTFSAFAALPREAVVRLIISGLIGFALADTLIFQCLNRIGVGLTSIVDCLYTPATIFFSYVLLAERLHLAHFVGVGLILTGVLVASNHEPPPGRTRGQIIAGILLGAVAVCAMGFGIVLAKPVLQVYSLLATASVRLVAGIVGIVAVMAMTRQRAAIIGVFRPSAVWRQTIPASVLSTYLCLLLWLAGFRHPFSAVSAALNQTSVLFAVVLAAIFLNERMTTRKLVAIALAVSGVLVTLRAE